MGQIDLFTTEFTATEIITSSANAARQELAFTGYFEENDTVRVVSLDACGRVLQTLASGLNVDFIEHNTALTFDSAVDTTTAQPAGGLGWYVLADNIDDGFNAVDRLYRRELEATVNVLHKVDTTIDSGTIDTPVGGQTTYLVPDVTLFRVGDEVQIISDNGLLGTANIVDIDINADEANNKSAIVIDDNIDITAETNVYMESTSLTVGDVTDRLQENIDAIDEPVENEDLDDPDGCLTAFETDNLFVQGTSHIYIDGNKKTLGTAGTRATLSQGSGDAELIYTSMILNTRGNNTEVSVSSGVGLTVTVTGNFTDGYTVDCTDNSGAATAAEIAAAINADATAKRIVQVQYGGDGSGVVASFVATNLAGGLDDATKDYAELPQIYNNEITLTGYKWISFNIRPDEKNRMNRPPKDTQEIVANYRKALVNV